MITRAKLCNCFETDVLMLKCNTKYYNNCVNPGYTILSKAMNLGLRKIIAIVLMEDKSGLGKETCVVTTILSLTPYLKAIKIQEGDVSDFLLCKGI
jgi:hypothetical protein